MGSGLACLNGFLGLIPVTTIVYGEITDGEQNTVQDIGKLISAWCYGSGVILLLDFAGKY